MSTEFAMKFFCSSFVSFGGFFYCLKNTEIVNNAGVPNPGSKFIAGFLNALYFQQIIFLKFAVPHILSVRCKSQISTPIIERITIYVVNHLLRIMGFSTRHSFDDNVAKTDPLLFVRFFTGIHQRSKMKPLAICFPAKLTKIFVYKVKFYFMVHQKNRPITSIGGVS